MNCSMHSSLPDMRLAIIGNSHIGALKRAWDAQDQAERPFADAAFFGAMSAQFVDLAVDHEGLFAPDGTPLRERFLATSGGLSRIDFGAYDVIAFVGLGVPFRLMAAQMRDHVTLDLSDHHPAPNLMSEGMLRDMLLGFMAGRPLSRVAALLEGRNLPCRLFTLAQPCPPRKIFLAGGFLDEGLFETAFADALYRRFADFNADFSARFGATFVAQATETMVLPGITHDRFNQDFVTIGGNTKNRDDDMSHMNESYGIATLLHLRSVIEQKPTAACL
jgi:hypothetical protein